MSELNGDKARFQKYRKRKVLHRQRIRVLMARLQATPAVEASGPATEAANARHAERRGPAVTND